MFDFVRKHMKAMQLMLFVLIVPSFVLFGLEGYNRFQEKGETVARVDGRDITQQDWDNAHRSEVERMRQSMPTIDAKLLDSPEARYATLERLVRDRVFAAAVEKSHFVATDQRLARELQSHELIASLRGPDGKLDIARYRQILAAQGMTPEMFENQVRADIATRQVVGGILASSFASGAQAEVSLGAFFEQREAQVARFAPSDYVAKVQVSDADVEAFHKANPQMFQAPEQARIEYVVLDLDAVQKTVTVNEQDVKTYYEQNVARLTGQEERRASHILVAAPQGAPAAEREKAKARAEELRAAAVKNPDGFAELARKNSQDPASAPQGGDLNFFTRDAMVKPFADAAFAMKKGEISSVVESEFGYHVIRLTDIKVPKQRTFEEMRAGIEADLRKQMAQRKYAEAAEAFSNGVYEQSDSLKPVAEKLRLEVRTATLAGRQPAPGSTGALANPKFLAAVFAPDAVEKKRNTEALEVGPNQMVSGRVVEYSPARTRPLSEVAAQVREQLVAQRAAELARKDGEAKLAAWKANPAAASLPAAVTVSRLNEAKQPIDVVNGVLRADAAVLPAWVGIDLGSQGYAVAKVNKVVPRQVPAGATAAQEKSQYERTWASAEGLAYYDMLKERFKVKINVPDPRAGAKPATPAQ